MNFVLVGVGGIFGGICRFQLGKIISRKESGGFPLGTFLINISGAILLGLLTGAGAGGKGYLLFGDGFLGAYTTFSTFMYEGFHLFQVDDRRNAFVYVLGTLVSGVFGYMLGERLAGLLTAF
ncbi:putative fluoride ion transporter CrcB [bioreactor metagenome]|uniref:Putative fluoride ion transporter CrcB n=1 Tax=bioreactor metagenome TaxID=1076179 RepID=A0A644YHT9_9ZZZZ